MSEHIGPLQEKWLQSLEQYPERQMKLQLGKMKSDGTYTACCMGEYGLITGVCEWVDNVLEVKDSTDFMKSYTLPDVCEQIGLYGPSGGFKGMNGKSLANLNDNDTTWLQIAAIIRANPQDYLKFPM